MKVWDSYVRSYHWLQVGLIGGCWWSAEVGEMEWHLRLAAALAGLWISRIYWGLFGSETARFGRFVKGPGAVVAFARSMLIGKAGHGVGHNPLGALMVVALLLVIGSQLFSGLFTSDEIFTDGPLVASVSSDMVDIMSRWHHLNFTILQGLVVLHIVAVTIYAFKGEPLIPAMVTGKRQDLPGQVPPQLRSVWSAWLVFGVSAGGVYGWFF
jgi:cytochrome b